MDNARRNSMEMALIVVALVAAGITWQFAIRNVGNTAESLGISLMVAFAYWRFLRWGVTLYFGFRYRINRLRTRRPPTST